MIKEEYFRLVEMSGPVGVTAEEMSRATGCLLTVARNWLSRWKAEGYLEYVPPETGGIDNFLANAEFMDHRDTMDGKKRAGRTPGSSGRYRISDGCKWWGSKRLD